MKTLTIQRPGAIEMVEVKDPSPAPGWARVRVRAAAICMTDFEVLQGTIDAEYPLVPGHEWSGIVDATGSASDETWVGRKVVGDNELTCLECAYCRRGEWRRCSQFRQIGFQAPGAYAEYVLVPVRNLHELPDAVSFEQGSLLEPLGVGLAVAAMAQAQAGSTAIVLGVGPIGLNCLAALKASGTTRVLCLDLREGRRKLAISWGAVADFEHPDDLANRAAQWHPEGTDIVIDTTGNVEIVRLGISLTRYGGTFILAGYCGGRLMEIKPDIIHLRNLRILGAGSNCGFTAAAVRCVASGIIQTEQMITHRYRLEDYRSALSRDAVARQGYIKGVFLNSGR